MSGPLNKILDYYSYQHVTRGEMTYSLYDIGRRGILSPGCAIEKTSACEISKAPATDLQPFRFLRDRLLRDSLALIVR